MLSSFKSELRALHTTKNKILPYPSTCKLILSFENEGQWKRPLLRGKRVPCLLLLFDRKCYYYVKRVKKFLGLKILKGFYVWRQKWFHNYEVLDLMHDSNDIVNGQIQNTRVPLLFRAAQTLQNVFLVSCMYPYLTLAIKTI